MMNIQLLLEMLFLELSKSRLRTLSLVLYKVASTSLSGNLCKANTV